MTVAAEYGCPSGLAPADAVGSGADPSAFVRKSGAFQELELFVRGARCAGCIAKIEGAVKQLQGIETARLNLSTSKLLIRWNGDLLPGQITEKLTALGYGVTPFDPSAAEAEKDAYGRELIRSLAVAGFAMANIMLLSVAVWAASGEEMGEGTRTLFHYISALIAIPAAAYAGRPFFSSAWKAIRQGHANMDVPISLAVFLALSVSLAEAWMGGHGAYFDAAVMLLFFLLIGRWLDHSLRNRARSAARELLALQATTATKIDHHGHASSIMAKHIQPGDILRLAPGDRIPVDCSVVEGKSDIDMALLTGETLPEAISVGDRLSGGAINMSQPLIVRAEADVSSSLVAELVRLVEAGQQAKGRFTILADKAARAYVPIVHSLAALTFLGWMVFAGGDWRQAIMAATALLIITCPCALGLATPAVQVVATGQLFRRGILVKSGDALERLAAAVHFVFDKTGTLTKGKLHWLNADDLGDTDREYAAALARASRHPVSRAIVEIEGAGPVACDVTETPGRGLQGTVNGLSVMLGRESYVGVHQKLDDHAAISTTWLKIGDSDPVKLCFADQLREDSVETIRQLKSEGISVSLLSGDKTAPVAEVASQVGIEHWVAEATPSAKADFLDNCQQSGLTVMIGDGINDAPAMAHAGVSMSPGTAAEAAQTTADFIFQGDELSAVLEARKMALGAKRHILQNFTFAAMYNAIAAPLAMAGLVNPLIAALAMSGSSLIVTLNALRLGSKRRYL